MRMNMNMRKQKGLVFYIHVGDGFITPSMAITESFMPFKQESEVQCIDLPKAAELYRMNKLIVDTWKFSLKYPFVFTMIFHISNSFIIDLIHGVVATICNKKLLAYLRREKPDFIISTHFNSTGVLASLFKRHKLPIAFFGYNADVIISHRAYITNQVDKYFVATKEGYNSMIAQKMQKDKMALCGFPLKKNFYKQFQSQEVERKKLGLKNMFTLLISFGGEGLLSSYRFVQKLMRASQPMQAVVICGRSQQMYDQLTRLKKSIPNTKVRLIVKGYTTNMPDYMYCCDVTLGKSGLNTTFENIYMQKPFIVLYHLANETHAKRFAEKHGFAIPHRGHVDVITLLEKASVDPNILKPYQKNLTNHSYRFGLKKLPKTILSDTLNFQKRLIKRKHLFFDMAGTLCSLPIDTGKDNQKDSGKKLFLSKWEEINLAGIKAICGHAHLKIDSLLSQKRTRSFSSGFCKRKISS